MEENDGFDFDLGKYLEILIRQWMLILAAVLVCTVAAAIVILRKPVSYEASVIVASAKLGSAVTFGSTIETLTEGQGYTNIVDRKARLLSYITLIKNPIIAERVYADLQDDFGERLPEPGSLVDMVGGNVLGGSDSIEIIARNSSPELALAIARAWGERYVEFINDLYSTGGSENTSANIQAQIDEAYQAYTDAQQAYVTYLSTSPLEEYTRLAEELERLDRLMLDARSLQDQIGTGGEAAASNNAVVLSLLKAQAFAATPGLENVQVQFAPSDSSQESLVNDVDSLIAALEQRYLAIENKIALIADPEVSESGGSGNTSAANPSPQLTGSDELGSGRIGSKAEQYISYLLAQVEYETGQKKERELARDVAWLSYSNLATKEVELAVASQTGAQEVVLGAPAWKTETISNYTQPIFLAAVAGLILGVFSAFGIEYWWGYKGIKAQPVLMFGGRKRNP